MIRTLEGFVMGLMVGALGWDRIQCAAAKALFLVRDLVNAW